MWAFICPHATWGDLAHFLLIKIKLLPASFEKGEKEALIESIVKATQSELIETVGNVVVLHKR